MPRLVVEGAARNPLSYGLFSVLTPRPEGDRHWLNDGVTWEALSCAPVSGIGQPDCEPNEQGQTVAEGLPKNFEHGGSVDEATPFTVYGNYKCSPIGHTLDYAKQRAAEHLLVGEQRRVEQALWTGDLGNEPNFVSSATELTVSAVDAIEALDVLEGYIGDTFGSAGVIHVPRRGFMSLAQSGLIVTSGAQARTLLGTPVIAGSGYPATDLAGDPVAAGTAWAVVTPMLFGYRSDVTTASDRDGDLLDRGVNDLYAIAERGYLVGFDTECGVGAINFTLGGT